MRAIYDPISREFVQNTLERRLAIELKAKFDYLLNQETALAISRTVIDFLGNYILNSRGRS